MKYTESEKTIEIKTKETFSVSEPTASMALSEFEKEIVMHIPELVPFHAVDKIAVETNKVERNRIDPYGCNDIDMSNKVCRASVCNMKVEC